MKLVKKLHRWLSVIVGIQLIIWITTGLYFNLISNQWHYSDTYKQVGAAAKHSKQGKCPGNPYPIAGLGLTRAPLSIELKSSILGCYYLVQFRQVFHQYQTMEAKSYSASTGSLLTEMTSEQAVNLAINSYTGPGSVTSISKLPPGKSSNGKQQNRVFRIDFLDDRNTSVFVHAITREVIRHENDNSRFHKFMFTLHFMDYFTPGNFNNWLLKLFGGMTLMLTITGVYWLLVRISNRQLMD